VASAAWSLVILGVGASARRGLRGVPHHRRTTALGFGAVRGQLDGLGEGPDLSGLEGQGLDPLAEVGELEMAVDLGCDQRSRVAEHALNDGERTPALSMRVAVVWPRSWKRTRRDTGGGPEAEAAAVLGAGLGVVGLRVFV